MGFIKFLIGLPVLIVILIFSFVNNDYATFNLWPFALEVTVSLSVAIVFLIVFGFVLGWFFTWLSYAPVRKALRQQKKENRKLSKEQQKLVEKVSGLQSNLETIKATVPQPPKVSLKDKIKNAFASKPQDDTSSPVNK